MQIFLFSVKGQGFRQINPAENCGLIAQSRLLKFSLVNTKKGS